VQRDVELNQGEVVLEMGEAAENEVEAHERENNDNFLHDGLLLFFYWTQPDVGWLSTFEVNFSALYYLACSRIKVPLQIPTREQSEGT
jgi:hypothetical protein